MEFIWSTSLLYKKEKWSFWWILDFGKLSMTIITSRAITKLEAKFNFKACIKEKKKKENILIQSRRGCKNI